MKSEKLNKKTIIYTLDHASKTSLSIKREVHETVYFVEKTGNYRIEKYGYNFYCRNKDFYACPNYCMILDPYFEKEAKEAFKMQVQTKLNEMISHYETSIKNIKSKIKSIKNQ